MTATPLSLRHLLMDQFIEQSSVSPITKEGYFFGSICDGLKSQTLKAHQTPPHSSPWRYLELHTKKLTEKWYITVVQPDTLKKITVDFSKQLQRHLATKFYPDVLVAQIIIKETPLSSLVSLTNVKAPRGASLCNVRGLAEFCPGFVKCISHLDNSSICFHGNSDF